MRQVTWDRLGAATGILFFVLMMVTVFTEESPPGPEATPDGIIAFYTTASPAFRWSVVLGALGMGALIWFLESLRSALAAAEGPRDRLAGVAYGGGLLTALLMLAAIAVSAQPLMDLEALSSTGETAVLGMATAQLLVTNAFVGLSTVTRGVMLAAAGIAALRYRALPAWLGWFGTVLGVASLTGTFTLIDGGEGPLGMVWFLSYVFFPIWILLAAVVLTARPYPREAVETKVLQTAVS